MPKSISPRLRLIAVAVAGLAVVGMAVTWMLHTRRASVPGFTWAKAQGWDVQTVRVVHLQPPWLARFESLPPRISPLDTATVRVCSVNPGDPRWKQFYDKNGSTLALRRLYESAVAQYPNAFYPEYCLADWYAEHKNIPQYQHCELRALHHAPAVLASRVEYEDGRPVAGARVQLILSAYEMGQFGAVQYIGWYPYAMTDSEGCYYVPVFRGIYGMEGPGLYSGPDLTDSQGRRLNFFLTGGQTSDGPTSSSRMTLGMVAVGHVGVLPKIIARPPIQVFSPTGQATNDKYHPALITGNALNLAWKPVSGAVKYTAQIEGTSSGDVMIGVMMDDPLFRDGTPATHSQVPLDGQEYPGSKTPLFHKGLTYSLTIYAHGSDNPEAPDYNVNTSGDFYFRLSDAAPPPKK